MADTAGKEGSSHVWVTPTGLHVTWHVALVVLLTIGVGGASSMLHVNTNWLRESRQEETRIPITAYKPSKHTQEERIADLAARVAGDMVNLEEITRINTDLTARINLVAADVETCRKFRETHKADYSTVSSQVGHNSDEIRRMRNTLSNMGGYTFRREE